MGPGLFNQVKCDQCGTKYNGKTGKSNFVRIAIYFAISLVIAAAIGILVFASYLGLNSFLLFRQVHLLESVQQSKNENSES